MNKTAIEMFGRNYLINWLTKGTNIDPEVLSSWTDEELNALYEKIMDKLGL
jgi:hypothetical protein